MMEEHILQIVLIIEGATEKVQQFIMPMKSIEQHAPDTNAGKQQS
jgi:hypothetical protein